MSFILCHGRCVSCQTILAFNPEKVPSIRVHGKREPLCRACFNEWNRIHRISKGLPPVELHPDAYAPADESLWAEI